MKKKFLFIFSIFLLFNLFGQQQINKTLFFDGQNRNYIIYIPASYNGSVSYPMLFSFHGGGGTSNYHLNNVNDMRSIADTENFIAVYPQALTDPQNGDATWMHKAPTTHDDIYFISSIIDTISTQYNIDLSRVYACGYSNGGEFAYDLACRLNAEIAAIGAVARTMYIETFNNCSPSHPTGILTILGTSDNTSNYNGVTFNGIQYYLSADDQHNYWATQNNCGTVANTTLLPDLNTGDGSTVERNTWSTNSGCTYVEELKVIGGGHDWPGSFGNMDINATQEIWSFVSKYDINGLINCASTNVISTSDLEIKIFPNPTSDFITINSLDKGNLSYSIFSTIGKMVMKGNINTSNPKINISNLEPQLYILMIGGSSHKIIKK